MTDGNTAWKLEEFVDSLVVELDKTRETLAVKAINKPLSYTVRELALDLNIFPSYDGDEISFVTAQPGQEGSSKVTIQLGTITDQQVRATTKTPGLKSDVDLSDVEVDKKTRKKLRKYGVTSASDIKQIESKNVDLRKATDDSIDYSALANQIEKSRRRGTPPRVMAASMSVEDGCPILTLRGENLAVNDRFEPVAVVNEVLADVVSSSAGELRIRLDRDRHRLAQENEVVVTVDPFAVVRMRVKGQPK
jgi:hypothetical protein